MMRTDRLSVQGLDPELIKELKNFVKTKYGKTHTVLGLTIQEAIRNYLDEQSPFKGDTHTKLKNRMH